MAVMSLEAVEERSRCRDMRARWKLAQGQRIFYERLFQAFAILALAFLAALLFIWFTDAQKAGAGLTFITTIVSGGLAAFFFTQRQQAQAEEKTQFDAYNAACPVEVRTLIDER